MSLNTDFMGKEDCSIDTGTSCQACQIEFDIQGQAGRRRELSPEI